MLTSLGLILMGSMSPYIPAPWIRHGLPNNKFLETPLLLPSGPVISMAKEHIDQIGQGQPRKLRECLNRDDWQDPRAQLAQLPGLLYLVGKACGLTRTH